jgi:aminocarboxymuconate-semialdehyde decarboxylase
MSGLVDVHSHAIAPELRPSPAAAGYGRWPVVERSGDEGAIVVGGRLFREIDARCWSAQRRIEDLDAGGVDVHVVSPVPITFCYDAPAPVGVELARGPCR